MLKILFIFDSFSPIGGGSQTSLYRWLENFHTRFKKKVDFRLYVSAHAYRWSKELLKRFKPKILTGKSISLNYFYKYLSVSYKVEKEIIERIKNFHPDIIQLNDPSLIDLKFISMAKKQKILLGTFFHTNTSKLNFPLNFISIYQQFIIKNSDFILCPSQKTKEYWKNKIKTKPIYRIYYPVKSSFFSRQNKNKTLKKNINLLFLGRLTPEKNVKFLINLMRLLPLNYKLKIAGDGILKKQLESLIKKFKLEDKIKLLGWLNENEVKKEFEDSHFLLLPSAFETFGIVYIEALANFVPVITLKTEVSQEVIPANTGVLLEKLSLELWQKTILKINDKKYQTMLDSIKKNYSYFLKFKEENSTSFLLKVYKKIKQKS